MTTLLGTVAELWRYPVKSMRGERIEATDVDATYGVSGDRGWAVRDDDAGEIRNAKKIPALLQCSARYVAEPVGTATLPVEITLPDGTTVRSDDPAVGQRLSDALGFHASLWPRVAAEDADHYLRIPLDEAEQRRQYALEDGEALPGPDLTAPPRRHDLRRYVSPLGTYFDADELTLLTTSTLDALGERYPAAGIDVRRYRPNVLVDTGTVGTLHGELCWIGNRLRIGTLVVDLPRRIRRCSMIVHAQAELPRDRSVLRDLIRETDFALGVAAEIVTPGRIAIGDPVELL